MDLNFFPPSSDVAPGFWNSSTDGARILANAFNWVIEGGGGDSCIVLPVASYTKDSTCGKRTWPVGMSACPKHYRPYKKSHRSPRASLERVTGAVLVSVYDAFAQFGFQHHAKLSVQRET